MAAETDGRSASAPVSASQSSTVPSPPRSTDYIDGTAARGLPGATPSFFANPFMTPFLPQQSAVPQQNPGDGGEYRMNPLPTDGYFLQNIQYQEMMQQYIHSLMAAASSLPSVTADSVASQAYFGAPEVRDSSPMQQSTREDDCKVNTPVPVIPQVQQQPSSVSRDVSPNKDEPSSVSACSQFSCPQDSSQRNVLEQVKPKVPETSADSSKPEGPVQEKSEKEQESELSVEEGLNALDIADSESAQLCHSQEDTEATLESEVPYFLVGNEASTSNEGSSEGNKESVEESVPQKDSTPGDTSPTQTPQINRNLHYRQSSESLAQNSAGDNRTSVLIKKQMSEIDKEINRRIQNKNIKKAALPFGATESKVAEQPATKPSLNQLKTAYGLAQVPGVSLSAPQSVYQSHFPQQTATPPLSVVDQPNTSQHLAHAACLPLPATLPPMVQPNQQFAQSNPAQFPPYFPPAQAMFFPGTQQPVTPQLAAVILQQLQQGQQMGMFPSGPFPFMEQAYHPLHTSRQTDYHHSGAAATSNLPEHGIPPPPAASTNRIPVPQSGKVNVRRPTAAENANSEHHSPDDSSWKEIDARHKANTTQNSVPIEKDEPSEPVWVMRDSYLKRIQREEDRNSENIEAQKNAEKSESAREETVEETERLLAKGEHADEDARSKKTAKKEVIVHEPAVLIEGVLFRARYLGSTQLVSEGRPTKTSRMMQAQEAVARVKAPAGEIQPSTDIDLFISTEKIMVLNTDLQDILMDHALRTISYIADIGDLVVLMARRMSQSASEEECTSEGMDSVRRTPRVICHVFESEEASFIAQSIGQAFQVAYVEFLRANGIDDPSYLREIDYQEVLNSQELMGEELEMFARKETQKDVVVPKKAGEPLGVVVVESGWGSMLPTVVIANLQPGGAASRCNQLNIGDQIIAINGISLVGLPLASAQQNIKATRSSTAVKLTVVSTPPVVEVRIKRPDTKYQLGFSVQNGVICSLLRGGIAERGGIRVGHRIIEINSQSVVAVAHEKIVNMLATAIGEIHMKTMPTSMFRLLTGQEVPNYI